QDVQATECHDSGLHKSCRLLPVGDIGSVGDGFATGCSDLVDHALRGATAACRRTVQPYPDVIDDDARTLSREGQPMRATDTAARSGDDDDTAVDQAHTNCSLTRYLLALEAARYWGGSPPPCTSSVAPLM